MSTVLGPLLKGEFNDRRRNRFPVVSFSDTRADLTYIFRAPRIASEFFDQLNNKPDRLEQELEVDLQAAEILLSG